ncbi:MAG: hypothetical protein AAFN11_05245 [Chloroflexota bacterium]
MQGKRSIREILIRLIDNLDLLYDKHHELYIPYHIAYIELRGRTEQDFRYEAWLWREWLERAYPQDAGSNGKPEQNNLGRESVNGCVSKV